MVKFGPWTPDRPYAEGGLSECLNVVPSGEGYIPLPTLERLTTSAVTGTVLGAFSSRLVGSLSKTYVGTSTSLFERNGAGWTDVSKAGDYTLTSARWEFTQWEDDIYACSVDSTLQKQTAGTGDFADVSGGPKAACIANVREWVVVGDLDESGTLVPHKIRWCDIGNPSSWSSPGTNAAEAAQAGAQELDAVDGRVMGIAGGEFGLILQQNAITRMSYVGAPLVWQFDKLDSLHGAECPGSIVQVGRRVFFLSSDGFRVTDGSGASEPVGDGDITKWVRGNLNWGAVDKITGAYDSSSRVVVWAIPTTTDSADSLLILSLQTGRFSHADFGAAQLFEGANPSVTLDGLDSYSASLDDLQASLDSNVWVGGQIYFAAIDSSGYLCTLTGTPGDSRIVTNEYQPTQGQRTFIQYVEPIARGAATVYIGTRNLPTDAVTYSGASQVNSRTGHAPFRTSGRYIQVRFDWSGDFGRADGFNIAGIPGGVA